MSLNPKDLLKEEMNTWFVDFKGLVRVVTSTSCLVWKTESVP